MEELSVWGYGATVARLTPDQTVGRSNRSGLTFFVTLPCSTVSPTGRFRLQDVQKVERSSIRDSIVVSISACHADDPGSIPGRGVLRASGLWRSAS